MTDKENFYQLVRWGNPEWIPSRIPEYAVHYKGCHHDNFEGQGHHSPVGTVWKDIWGVEWHKDLEGVMGFPRGFPLTNLETLDSFEFPDPDDPKYFSLIFEMKKNYKEDLILYASHRDTLWERAYMLVGMENMMVYFRTEPDLVKRFFRRITDFQIKMAQHYIEAGCELIGVGDDHGMQSTLLLGKDIIYEFFMPEYQRLFDFYRNYNKNIIINFHSCGYIEPILDMFIELGITILNPIQATSNNLENVRKKTQGKITLCGGINSGILMDGNLDEIRALVKSRIEVLGKNGGYICCPDQGMPYKKESLDVMNEAILKYGRLM